MTERVRCGWAPSSDPAYLDYHDSEWGVPVHDEHRLFEMLTLEGAQAGLSWSTILRKRDGYRAAFLGFDADAVAQFSTHRIEELLADPSIVRNRLKVESTVSNARAILALREAGETLDGLLWDHAPEPAARATLADIPAETPASLAMSKDLKRRGFRFVGPTVCYAFMQACGLVNDHTTGCFRYRELQDSR
ncbi:MAG: DNA-3-methyladenine glycosylase [Actinomycetota bacterium]|nr:DNA-3-methyladenine glycosylase [Actinomycetota bacterium]